MSMERTWRCDGPDCEKWAGSFPHPHPPLGFLKLYEGVSTQSEPLLVGVYCSNDCLLRHAARIEPAEVFPFHDPED